MARIDETCGIAGDSCGNGDCPFTEKVIPYLMNIKARGGGLTGRSNISGVAEYDVVMSTYGLLGLMLSNTLKTNKTRWLRNVGLWRRLQAVESISFDGHSRSEESFEQYSVLRGCIADCIMAECAAHPINVATTMEGDESVARLCDLAGAQIIKDLFYVFTGTRTPGDVVDPRQKTYEEFSPSVEDGEELNWAPYCELRGSSVDECSDASSHRCGVVPIIGVLEDD